MTTIAEIIEEELPAFLARTGQETFRILEIGVLRARDEDHEKGDGHSTLAFAQMCARFPGSSFLGVDLKVADAMEAVNERGLGGVCDWVQGDSLETLVALRKAGQRFNVIYLDCDNSASATMAEYELALRLLDRPGLVMGDDMNLDHREVQKGRLLIPWLRGSGAPFILRQRLTPWDSRDVLVQDVS